MRLVPNSKLLIFFPRWVEAFTFKDTVFLRYATIPDWLKRHEQVHVEQYRREGTIKFLVKYFYYNFRYGYVDNPFEVEAREAEKLC